MKFSIMRSKFIEGLKSVQNVVGTKGTLPILQNVLMEVENGVLRMTTTDLDISITSETECEVEQPGKSTLPVKILFNSISRADEGVIEIEVNEDEKARIKAGSANFRLTGMSEVEFPRFPIDQDAYKYVIPQTVLKEMLRKTSYAASQDDTRRTLKGVLMSFKDGKLTMVATDGRRLALVENELEFPKDAEKDIVLPSKAVQEIQRSLGSEGDVSIMVQKTQICFNLGNVTIYSKLMDEPYPNYRQVIPQDCELEVIIDRQLMINALERASVMSMDETHSTKLKFENGKLTVSAAASDIGEAKDEVPIKYSGEELEIMFNPAYIMEPLKAIDDDEVTIKLRNGQSPAVIKCSVPFLYVIMPLRVN